MSPTPKVVFEDSQVLLVDKPAGMVVNKSETTKKVDTLQAWIEKKFPNIPDFSSRAGIVHRLDKETSGLLVIAKTPSALANLQAQFKNRQVVKKYLTLVHGRVVPKEGEIKAPIARLPWNRQKFGVIPGGREAATKYQVLCHYRLTTSDYSLLEVTPLTGRTHQIRVHLKYQGFPIVADSFYAGKKRARQDRKFCPRVFLHASYLKVKHPLTGQGLEFESVLPADLAKVLLDLKPDE